MNKYILGIDGGGTKTLGVVWDIEGNEIRRVEKGFANFNVDTIKSKENIENTINDLITNLEGQIDVYMGISGNSGLKNPDEYALELKKKFNLNKVLIESDGYLSLYSVENKNDLPVIMVIGGTGSIVYTLKDKEINRFGGYGHILGDQGSAYHLVIESFKFIIYEYEFKDESSDFSKEIMKMLNIKNPEELKGLVYNTSKDKIASYAKHLSILASKNNETAIELLEKEGRLLAKQVINSYNKLFKDEQVIIAIRGGFISNAEVVNNAFIEELNKNNINYLLDNGKEEPIIGAWNSYIRNAK